MENSQMLLMVVLPIAILALVVMVMLYIWKKNENDRRRFEMLQNTAKETISSRLVAYERLTIFLERINPDSMVVRISSNGLNSYEYHSLLLRTIREEFEHNVAQQLYVSPEAWTAVKEAKDSIVKLISESISTLPPQMPAFELIKEIVETYTNINKPALQKALDVINAEVKTLFA